MLTLSAIYIYPIKSLGGISLPAAQVTDRGLQYDRRWMLVDEQGNFLSQRELPAMALFGVALLPQGLLVTHEPTGDTLSVPFAAASGDTGMVDIWSDRCRAQYVSAEAGEWFSKRLGVACRLVYMPDATRRRVDGRYAIDKDITSFSDGYPMLVIGQASLDDLNSRLPEPVGMERFRPNLVVSGGTPYEEDGWEAFRIGSIELYGVKRCARCVMITIAPGTAEKGKEPLRTLAGYRSKHNKIYFGQNLLHKGEGILHTGEAVTIMQSKNS